jgi:protein ImuB
VTRRFLSLWFALLPTDRAHALRRDKTQAPLATIAKVNSAQRLVGVDRRAAALGLHPGLSLADARARYPDLIAVEADPVEEARLLQRVADWCQRFTPLVALDGADGIMLDISGVAHLFEGEEKMAEAIEARLAGQGLGVALAIADAPRAAWALARFSDKRIAPSAMSEKAFARLFHDMPAAALGLDEKTIADLARAGLRRIGDLAMRPRAPIAARFGAQVMSRLDALSGRERGAISPRFPAPDFCAERRFASAILHKEAVEIAIAKLADDLVVLLERQAKGARRLELCLFRVDGALRRIQVGASRPLNEARAIARLFAERLEAQDEDEIDPGYGIDVMRLSCLAAEPLAPSQRDLERAHEGERARALADLLDRLSARLGPRRVTRLEPVDTHIPEHAIVAVPVTGRPSPQPSPARGRRWPEGPDEGGAPARPIRLFERPERIETIAEIPDGPPLRFRWRRVLHEIAAIEGPERIAPEWWRREAALTRDYFRAEDKQGRRFWLYREGLYGRESVRWFVQGAMA